MTEAPTADATGIEQHGRDVYRWAYRVLGSHHDALDVTQDVLMRWTARGADEGLDNPRAWLRRAAINRAIDVRRCRPAGGGRPPAAAPARTPRTAPAPDPAEQRELRGDVAGALAALTEIQRCVLVAKVHDGLTFAAIAAEHGLAVPTVKTHYLRALSAVRDRLHRRWGPPRSE